MFFPGHFSDSVRKIGTQGLVRQSANIYSALAIYQEVGMEGSERRMSKWHYLCKSLGLMSDQQQMSRGGSVW